jgi:hypothetical protein
VPNATGFSQVATESELTILAQGLQSLRFFNSDMYRLGVSLQRAPWIDD